MEKQEPVGNFVQHPSNGLWEQDGYGDNPDASPLYAHPGAQAQPAPSVPEGWKLVPIEPTHEMVKACASAARAYMQEYGENSPRRVMWAAMLAAAPKPEGE